MIKTFVRLSSSEKTLVYVEEKGREKKTHGSSSSSRHGKDSASISASHLPCFSKDQVLIFLLGIREAMLNI